MWCTIVTNNCVAHSKQFIFKNVQTILSPSEDTKRSLTEDQEEIRDALTLKLMIYVC